MWALPPLRGGLSIPGHPIPGCTLSPLGVRQCPHLCRGRDSLGNPSLCGCCWSPHDVDLGVKPQPKDQLSYPCPPACLLKHISETPSHTLCILHHYVASWPLQREIPTPEIPRSPPQPLAHPTGAPWSLWARAITGETTESGPKADADTPSSLSAAPLSAQSDPL